MYSKLYMDNPWHNQSMEKQLKKYNYEKLNLRHINQDPLENFFSQVRDFGHQDNNPTPSNFCNAYKSLLITNLTSKHSPSANCEATLGNISVSLTKLFEVSEIAAQSSEIEVECVDRKIQNESTFNVSNIEDIINTLQKDIQCVSCSQEVNNTDLLANLEISLIEVENTMPDICYKVKIKEKIVQIVKSKITFNMHCSNTIDIIAHKLAENFLFKWCIYMNKILNGSITDVGSNFIASEAQKCASRYCRKKKKYVKV